MVKQQATIRRAWGSFGIMAKSSGRRSPARSALPNPSSFLVILIGAVAYSIPKTQAILAPWASAINGWQIATGVLGIIVLIRLALAPYWIFKQQSQRIDDLAHSLSIPDIAIEIRRTAEMLTNPDDETIVHVLVRDFHLTNRSDFSASIEVRLKICIGGMTLYPDQDDLPLGLGEAVKELSPPIGRHLGRIISLPAYNGVIGYLMLSDS